MSTLFIILVSLTMTLFSEKVLSIDALVVWCPTWSKNLGRTLRPITFQRYIENSSDKTRFVKYLTPLWSLGLVKITFRWIKIEFQMSASQIIWRFFFWLKVWLNVVWSYEILLMLYVLPIWYVHTTKTIDIILTLYSQMSSLEAFQASLRNLFDIIKIR